MKQVVKWTAEGAVKWIYHSSRVFCDVWAYVICPGYVGTVSYTHLDVYKRQIHNSGCNESRHDGIHTFHVGKNANVRYEEKHYGEGNGTGARVLNPVDVYKRQGLCFVRCKQDIKYGTYRQFFCYNSRFMLCSPMFVRKLACEHADLQTPLYLFVH